MRTRRIPTRCEKCGDYVEIDRQISVKLCLRCSPPRATLDAAGGFAEPGIWRVGPVVFDWDGAVSVVRCEACPSFGEWRWGERIYRTAINHARLWHGVGDLPGRILAPMRTVECEGGDCSALVTTSEDYPDRFCAAHREAAA